jgi:hypothetical protein
MRAEAVGHEHNRQADRRRDEGRGYLKRRRRQGDQEYLMVGLSRTSIADEYRKAARAIKPPSCVDPKAVTMLYHRERCSLGLAAN